MDGSLLNDTCGRWETANEFSFGPDPGKKLAITFEVVGRILNIP